MIAAVKKVAKKCSGSCHSLSHQKMEVHVHALSSVEFLQWGRSSFSWTVCPGLEKSKVARVHVPVVPEMLKDTCKMLHAHPFPCLVVAVGWRRMRCQGKGHCSALHPFCDGVLGIRHIRLKVQIMNA